MEPFENTKTRVKDHAQRAFILSQLETLPPGYTREDWAILLMGNPYAWLKDRFEGRVQREKVRHETAALKNDPLFAELFKEGQGFLPAVPKNPPAVLVVKARQVYDLWLEERVWSECHKALAPLAVQGLPRSVAALSKGITLVKDALAGLAVDEEIVLPWRPTVTMNKDGTFAVRLDKGKKQSGVLG